MHNCRPNTLYLIECITFGYTSPTDTYANIYILDFVILFGCASTELVNYYADTMSN